MTAPAPAVDIRRADERFATRISWLDSKHSFSFGRHYDPANTHHGLLLVNNDDVVAPGAGFETHPHRDMEIVTWVLRGSLVHQDSDGHTGRDLPGPGPADERRHRHPALREERLVARSTAGRSTTDPVHFVQMWVLPDEQGIDPGYEQLEIDDELLRGGLVPVASGHGPARRRDRDPDPQPVRRPARRPARGPASAVDAARRAVRAPVRRPRRRSTSRAPGRSARATPPGSPRPAASG